MSKCLSQGSVQIRVANTVTGSTAGTPEANECQSQLEL